MKEEQVKDYYNPMNREHVDYGLLKKTGGGYNYTMKFVLTKLFGARVMEAEDEEGHMEKGVFIPLDRNDLRIDPKGNVSVHCFVSKCFTNNKYDYWTHYIKLKSSPTFVKKMNSLGYKMPYLGNLKAQNYVVHKNNYDREVKRYQEED